MIPQIFAAIGAILIANEVRKKRRSTVTPIGDIQKIIVAESQKQGLDPAIAILFAELETNSRNITGDPKWPYRKTGDGRTNWEKYVRDEKRYNGNQFREDASLWISYGPFQLLSPHILYQYKANADPRILSDVKLNAKLAVAKIIRLREKYKGNIANMRIAYVCGSAEGCGQTRRNEILASLRSQAPRFGIFV